MGNLMIIAISFLISSIFLFALIHLVSVKVYFWDKEGGIYKGYKKYFKLFKATKVALGSKVVYQFRTDKAHPWSGKQNLYYFISDCGKVAFQLRTYTDSNGVYLDRFERNNDDAQVIEETFNITETKDILLSYLRWKIKKKVSVIQIKEKTWEDAKEELNLVLKEGKRKEKIEKIIGV